MMTEIIAAGATGQRRNARRLTSSSTGFIHLPRAGRGLGDAETLVVILNEWWCNRRLPSGENRFLLLCFLMSQPRRTQPSRTRTPTNGALAGVRASAWPA